MASFAFIMGWPVAHASVAGAEPALIGTGVFFGMLFAPVGSSSSRCSI
jgi:hypothetical protein